MVRRVWWWMGIVLISGTLVFLALHLAKQCRQFDINFASRCGKIIKILMPQKYRDFAPFEPYYNYLLGYDQPTTYLILLQNDNEMRANGGFFGSYAVMNVNSGQIDIRFQDIYVPDGQLGSGHVEAPAPIEEAFGLGGFYLRDSDWESDFVLAAKTIRWFFMKGGEVNPDVLVTISLTTIKKILSVTGPIRVPDDAIELTAENIFELLQAKVETDFFPGSTQKKDVLSGVGRVFHTQLLELPWRKKLMVLDILWQEAKQKNILFHTTNQNLQAELQAHNLTGSLTYPRCKEGKECLIDVFRAVEANLGANKANCCTQTKTIHTITDQGEKMRHEIEIIYTNNSKEENPQLPNFFGGNYINYVRFYIPKLAINLSVKADPSLPTTLPVYPLPYTTDPSRLEINDYYLFKEIGMFHITRAMTSSSINLSYELAKTSDDYELHILKQNGMHVSPQEIIFGESVTKTELTDDFVFSGVK